MAKRKRYSKEEKLDAVRKWQESGKGASAIAKELNISASSLYTWRDQLSDELAEPTESVVTEELTAEEGIVGAEDGPESVEDEIVEQSPEEEVAEVVEEPSQKAVEPEPDAAAAVHEETAVEKATPLEVATAPLIASAEGAEEPPKARGAWPIFKRVLGGIGAFLGAVGVLLALIFIIVTWALNKPVTDRAVSLVNKVEVALTVADAGLDKVDQRLDRSRQRLRDIAEAIPLENLQSTISDMQNLVDGMKTTADTAASVVGLADTFPANLLLRNAEPVETPKLDRASDKLTDISTRLENVLGLLEDREESGLGPITGEIDNRLSEVQASILEVDQSVEAGIATTVQIQDGLPGVIDTISYIFTFLFLWLGTAMYALMHNGWHWLRWT